MIPFTIPLRLKLEAAAVVVCLVFGVGMCAARDAEIRKKAVLAERLKGADRDLDVWLKHAAHSAARVDTTIRTVLQTIAAVPDTIRLTEKITDTVWVREYVERSEDARAACGVLVTDCARFRVTADSASRAYDRKIALLEAMPRGCSLRERGTAGAVGGVLGAVLGAYVRGR